MEFIIEKNNLLNKIRIVEKITAQKGNQPILSNILIKTISSNEIKFCSTDNDLFIETIAIASVKEEGSITLPAKKLSEIVSKLPEKPVLFKLENEGNKVFISCEKTNFEVLGISSEEFPSFNIDFESKKEGLIELDRKPFEKAIKGTAYAAANYENRNIISGVFVSLDEDKVEMAATDGNRLTRIIQNLEEKNLQQTKIVVPSRTLQELLRILSIESDEKISILKEGSSIYFKNKETLLYSKLLEGEYPPYQQLIPKTTEKKVVLSRENMINALDRVSTMVNERTSFVKFVFNNNELVLTADTPEAGKSEEKISLVYKDEELKIAFNYKYVLEALRNMDSENIEIALNGSLSATIFRPENDENYLSLIMPIQIR